MTIINSSRQTISISFTSSNANEIDIVVQLLIVDLDDLLALTKLKKILKNLFVENVVIEHINEEFVLAQRRKQKRKNQKKEHYDKILHMNERILQERKIEQVEKNFLIAFKALSTIMKFDIFYEKRSSRKINSKKRQQHSMLLKQTCCDCQ